MACCGSSRRLGAPTQARVWTVVRGDDVTSYLSQAEATIARRRMVAEDPEGVTPIIYEPGTYSRA